MSKRNAAKKLLERVNAAFDPEALVRICEQPQSAFSDYGDKVQLPDRKGWRGGWMENFYFFKDNGAPILFVAHLDNVQQDRTCRITDSADGPVVLSGALDDRLGAYVGLEMLPKLGVTCDWLLTTNEETGNSSAEYFETDKQYNWMIEFDRGGTDVVLYQYETKEYRELVRASGAWVGQGSYSDIADLDHLDCAGFNWGVGYEDYHSKRSHAWLDDTFKMVGKFLKFYAANAAIHLPHIPISRSATGTTGSALIDQDCPLCPGYLDEDGCCWGCGYGVEEIYGESLSNGVRETDRWISDLRQSIASADGGAKEEASG